MVTVQDLPQDATVRSLAHNFVKFDVSLNWRERATLRSRILNSLFAGAHIEGHRMEMCRYAGPTGLYRI
ncbi:MAG: hypothetical protein NVSMB22_18910 [Chloroflexota bacterium]